MSIAPLRPFFFIWERERKKKISIILAATLWVKTRTPWIPFLFYLNKSLSHAPVHTLTGQRVLAQRPQKKKKIVYIRVHVNLLWSRARNGYSTQREREIEKKEEEEEGRSLGFTWWIHPWPELLVDDTTGPRCIYIISANRMVSYIPCHKTTQRFNCCPNSKMKCNVRLGFVGSTNCNDPFHVALLLVLSFFLSFPHNI